MAQFVVRNIEGEVKSRLRAKRQKRMMEEEMKDILGNAAREEGSPLGGLGTEIASSFTKIGLDTEIPELRGHEIKLCA